VGRHAKPYVKSFSAPRQAGVIWNPEALSLITLISTKGSPQSDAVPIHTRGAPTIPPRSRDLNIQAGRPAFRRSAPAMPRWPLRKTKGSCRLVFAIRPSTRANSARDSVTWYTSAGCVSGINVQRRSKRRDIIKKSGPSHAPRPLSPGKRHTLARAC